MENINEKRLRFVEKAEQVHNRYYGYQKVDYARSSLKVVIVCPIHGEFTQTPKDHLQGKGCRQCGVARRIASNSDTLASFIVKANNTHGGIYTYEKTDYRGSQARVYITCPTHGDFLQLPNNHIKGAGCPKCARGCTIAAHTKDREEIIQEAHIVHNYKYTYPVFSVGNIAKTKISITCPEHGAFKQLLINHVHHKTGCPKCAKYGFNPEKPAVLYYAFLPRLGLYKIGITNNSFNRRYLSKERKEMVLLYTKTFVSGAECYQKEQMLLKEFEMYRSHPKSNVLSSGHTEMFSVDISKLKPEYFI